MTSLRDLAELVRAPAALSVPGDALAGAAAAGEPIGRAAGLSAAAVCLYWAGMAANDWADRDTDALERPTRPVPSGRVSPATAAGTAAALTAAGLGLAAVAGGRRALRVAAPLAGLVWCYDTWLKSTPAGPAAMAACRGLDVLLGASGGQCRRAVGPALTVAAHTYTVTALSRREVTGGGPLLPGATLTGTAAVAAAAARSGGVRGGGGASSADGGGGIYGGNSVRGGTDGRRSRAVPDRVRGDRAGRDRAGRDRAGRDRAGRDRAGRGGAGLPAGRGWGGLRPAGHGWGGLLPAGLAAWYAASYGASQARALAAPDASHLQAAVGAGITGLPALQGALIARSGAPATGLVVAAAAPLGRRLARWVSPT